MQKRLRIKRPAILEGSVCEMIGGVTCGLATGLL